MQSLAQVLENNLEAISHGSLKNQTRLPANEQETSSRSTPNPVIEKRVDQLFLKFATFYGHIWKSLFKDERFFVYAKELWQDTLKEFDDAVFNQAILNCLSFYKMPPTLPDFLQVCRDVKRNADNRIAKPEPVYVRGSQEAGKFNMNLIHALLDQPLKYATN